MWGQPRRGGVNHWGFQGCWAGWPLRALPVQSFHISAQHLPIHYISSNDSLGSRSSPRVFRSSLATRRVITDLIPFNQVLCCASRKLFKGWDHAMAIIVVTFREHEPCAKHGDVCATCIFSFIPMVFLQPSGIGTTIIIPFWRCEHCGLGERTHFTQLACGREGIWVLAVSLQGHFLNHIILYSAS